MYVCKSLMGNSSHMTTSGMKMARIKMAAILFQRQL